MGKGLRFPQAPNRLNLLESVIWL